MDRFKQIKTFVAVVAKGSLSAAAQAEGVAPAVIGRRLDALEERLGVKLLVRTTRRLTPTFEGSAFLEDCQRVIHDMQSAEASVSAGGVKASGHLRVSAPAGFGWRHVVALVPVFTSMHPDVSITLDLTDRMVDLVNEGFDCAVRLGELPDSSLVSLKLGENQRVCVVSPEYLRVRGAPVDLDALAQHNCPRLGRARISSTAGCSRRTARSCRCAYPGRWNAPTAPCCTSGVSRDTGSHGAHGEVGDDIAHGRLVSVLEAFAAPPIGIHAVFPQRRHLPLRVRLFLDLLKHTFGAPGYWG